METENDVYLAFTSCADAVAAKHLAQQLVAERLAFCVQIGSPATSVYPWQGKIEMDQEVVLTIKTHRDRLGALEDWIAAHHDYALPELVWVRLDGGSSGYLEWAKAWLRGDQ